MGKMMRETGIERKRGGGRLGEEDRSRDGERLGERMRLDMRERE